MSRPVPKERPDDALLRYIGPAESTKLALSLAMSRGKAGITPQELKKLTVWAEWIANQSHMLRLILEGSVLVELSNANLEDFSDVTFKSTLKRLGPSASEEYVATINDAAKTVMEAMEKEQKANLSAGSDTTAW